MLIAPPSRRSLESALRAGPALVEAAHASGEACFAASLVERGGPAVVLGRHQRAARVLDLDGARRAGALVLRRRTAGTAAFVSGRALVFTLALPRVTALFPDASLRTLLNRHVRPFLKGLTAAGVLSHYFGREWVSSRRRPVMLLGFDVEPDGAALVEAFAGFDQPFSVPPWLASGEESAMDRYSGQPPAALSELLPEGRGPGHVLGCVTGAVAARASTPVRERADLLAGVDAAGAAEGRVEGGVGAAVARPCAASVPDAGADGGAEWMLVDLASSAPVPPSAALLPPARIPIGWLERARLPGGSLWLGGDVLAPRFWLDRVAAALSMASHEEELDVNTPMNEAVERVAAADLYSADPPVEGVSLAELLEKARSSAE